MSQSGLSAPASPDPDLSGTSSSIIEGQLYTNSRPESRSSISSNSMVDQDQAAESSRLSSNLDEIDRKSDSGEVIGLDENAQSGGLLDEHKQDLMASDSSKEGEDSLEMVSDDEMEANENCKDQSNKKSPQVLDTLIKDTELDFEEDNLEEEPKKLAEDKKADEDDEDGECDGEKAPKEKEQSEEEPEEGEELEEGEVSSEEDVGKHARMEPRPVCRFYSKGNCTWGNNCRFVHPGVLDKGNYNMFAPARPSPHNGPAGSYERPFERPPVVPLIPPAEWANSQPRAVIVRPPRHPQPAEPPRTDASGAESAWERGLRQAKELLKKSSHRKETDIDFEEKKLNLGLGEEELDKENDYYTRPASPVLHGDVPPPFEEPDTEPYHKYPPPAEGRWPPSRYPPPHRHPPPGYPYPYEGRRPYPPESEYREREYYHPEGYERPHYYGPKPMERDMHPSASKSQPQLPPGHEKRWPDERYVEVVPPTQRGRSDEWWDPWMRSRSPGGAGGGGVGSGGPSSGAVGVAGGNSSGAKGTRRRSYSSGSSFSTSSSTSSSSSSSYSSSSSRSSRSSASSRSTSQSKSMHVKRRQARKPKIADQRIKGNHKTASSLPIAKHKPSSAPIPSSPPHPQSSRKPIDKQRSIHERSPQIRNRDWSSSSSRSRSRSLSKVRPVTKNNSSALPTKAHARGRAVSGSSSSSEWESSPHSNDAGRARRTSNRGRRDFAERKELRGVNPPPLSSHTSTKGKAAPEPPKAETKQIKLTLKSAAPPLKKITNRFNDDSDDEGWEKEKPVPVNIPQPSPVTSSSQPTRKRIAESPPPTAPVSKVANISPQKNDKGGKKSAATRREELLKQLKAVEEAIAKKRSKLPA